MITYPTKNKRNIEINGNKAIVLNSVGKKFPFLKKRDHRAALRNIEDFWALKDVSLDVCNGEILGLIGRNGAGKTTLLNIIAGTTTPTEGELSVNAKVKGIFNLGVGFQDGLTGKENIFLNGSIIGAAKSELECKMRNIIDFSELGNFINMPLGSYSQGMRLRLAFSIVANLYFDMLLIDEVLAVGDILFQNKCFERLMDFRREGKSLVISTQDTTLIERFCDKVVLLDHGRILFNGEAQEAISRYHRLLNQERFFVGPAQKTLNLIENTKKWSNDMSNWGKKFGTKEVVIESVEFINRFGWKCNEIRNGDPLRIKVNFTARDKIKNPHFGIAVFRNDGVYCYGPNTKFDAYNIPEFKKGKGYFILDYHKIHLRGGEYRFSIAIWDKDETLAFDYHNGCYKLTIKGENLYNELLKMPYRLNSGNFINKLTSLKRKPKCALDLSLLLDRWGKKSEANGIHAGGVKLLNSIDEEKEFFMTNEAVKLIVNFDSLELPDKDSYLWIGIYREDGVYCQGITALLGKSKDIHIFFRRLPLLPGHYRISVGIWSDSKRKFLMSHHGIYPFRMVFDRQDHGTIYLEHDWRWLLP